MDSNWIAFEPSEHKSRSSQSHGRNSRAKSKLVRAAAATSSADARLRTMGKKRARNEGDAPVSNSALTSRSTSTATDECRNATMAGKAFDTYLWARMILNPDLHAVGMFLGSTEANFLGLTRHHGEQLQTTSLFLRGMALKCMQKASMNLSDPAADTVLTRNTASPHEATSSFAICLSALAGFEKIHGDQAAYTVHMNALRTIDNRETTSTIPPIESGDSTKDTTTSNPPAHRIFDVLSSVTSTIQKRCAEIGTFVSADGSFTIAPHLDTMLTTAGPTPEIDYTIYNLRRPDTRTLLFLLTRLANLNLLSPRAWPATYELSILVMAWRREGDIPRREWEGLLTHDDLENLTLYHIRLAMVSVLAGLSYAIGIARRDEGYFQASDSADLNYQVCLRLRTKCLLGTQFEEAALWSLYTITATADPGTWEAGTLDLLRKLISSPRNQIDSFEELEAVLRKYAYREVIHRKNCRALWKRVMEDVVPGEEVGLRKLEITFADLII